MEYKDFFYAIHNLTLFFKEQEKLNDVLKVISPTSTGVVEFGNKFVDDYIKVVSDAVGDKSDWVPWFIFDNDFGKKKMEAKVKNGKFHKVCTVKQLYNIIKNDI